LVVPYIGPDDRQVMMRLLRFPRRPH